ncbi:MAG: choice-of-anchor Q domain-containing protein [Flavipsychrobacter sp.]
MRCTPVIYILLFLLASTSMYSCKKEQLLTSGGQVTFSVDTLTFDTVFTSRGNVTASIKIYNPQNQAIKLSSVGLLKGASSYFDINVNGTPGNTVSDVDIAAKDSIYVFATVSIDPTNQNTPFLVTDELVANLNGREYKLPLRAFGQNAHYIVDSVLKTQTWLTDKPYVIFRNALVEEGNTLTIPAGCRVYVSANSRLFIEGTLRVNGTKTDSVVFQGDRLDRKYFGNEGYPGEWGGFYFTSKSRNSELRYAILRNCGNSTSLGEGTFTPAAIQVNIDTINDNNYQLRMYNTIIENSIGYGLLAFSSTVYAENCLINACGAQAFAAFEGGGYDFFNCDFIIYGDNKISHIDNPTVALLNYRDIDNVSYVSGPLRASMTNCIVWGSLENELFTRSKGTGTYDVTLNNCLIRLKETLPAEVKANNNILNQDPNFTDHKNWNFRLKSGSPAINAGITPPAPVVINRDLDDKARDVQIDIGCYEF